MSNSEIFNKYAERAIENGLISMADTKEKLESWTGVDSLHISAIESLYGIKPNLPKNMQYKKNIVEDAHPNAVIVSPSYDKLNGLVENINERQNIILNIVNKPADGHHTQHKYANDLILSLVRVANYMDNIDNNELMILADKCIEQLNMKKTIASPLGWAAGIAAVAVIGGLIYWSQHTNEINKGFVQNAENLIKQLEDLITSGTGFLSTRTEYRDEFKNQLKDVQNKIKEVLQYYDQINEIIDEIEAPKAATSLYNQLQAANQIANKPSYIDIYNKFKVQVQDLEPMLISLEKNFKNESYKRRQVKNEESVWSKINDMFGGIFYGGKGFIADEFDDVVHAIPPFRKSIEEVKEIIQHAQEAERMAINKYKDSLRQMQSYELKPETSSSSQNKNDEFKLTNLPSNVEDLIKYMKTISDYDNKL
jgi:hypothetical protein